MPKDKTNRESYYMVSYTNSNTTKPKSLSICQDILNELLSKRHNEYAWPFYKPVDVEKLGLYDYYKVITHPMDLGTIDAKLKNGEYKEIYEFVMDIRLIFKNCYKYNTPGHAVAVMAKKLEMVFENFYAKICQKFAKIEENNKTAKSTTEKNCHQVKDNSSCSVSSKEEWDAKFLQLQIQVQEMQKIVQSHVNQNRLRRLKKRHKDEPKKKEKTRNDISGTESYKDDKERQIPIREIKRLIADIGKLPDDHQTEIALMIQELEPSLYMDVNSEDVDVDPFALKPSTLRQLQSFTASCLSVNK